MQKPQLSNWEVTVLEHLISQPSDTERGQIEKMQDIEEMLGDPMKGGFSVRHLNVEDINGETLHNLIVHKGTEVNPQFTIMIPAHVDTVKASKSWMDANRLTREERNPDRLRGLGVFDMQAAVLNSMSLIKDLQVPEGVSVYFVFTVDEEHKSRGAKKLMRHWPQWADVDLVLSSEIGVSDIAENDPRMRYINGRCGIIKFDVETTVEGGIHASLDRERNAMTARRRWFNMLEEDFYSASPNIALPPKLGPIRKVHPTLGSEELQEWRGRTPESVVGANNPLRDEFGFRVQLVPPSNLEDALKVQLFCFREIQKRLQWTTKKIRGYLSQNSTQTSYAPFHMPSEHPLMQAIASGLHEYSIHQHPTTEAEDLVPVEIGTREWADENLYAIEGGKPVISIPYRGGGAHSPEEWASSSDIARVREAISFLITKTFREFGRKGAPH